MNKFTRLLAAVACTVPLVAGAQTSTSPSMETAPSPNIKPADATTSGKNTGNDNAGSSTNRSSSKPKDPKATDDKSKEGTPTGGMSTYPAPTRDGAPTSPATTK